MCNRSNYGYGVIAAVFCALAVSFILDLWGWRKDVVTHSPVEPWAFSPAPVRQAKLKPVTTFQGERFRCQDCHATLEPTRVKKNYMFAHPEIVLQHGEKMHCAACHSRETKETFRDADGSPIPYQRAWETCRQCHGPIFRDWEQGLHGRMNGHWDEQAGPKTRLSCLDCHDPHSPAFPDMMPSPSPHRENYRQTFQNLFIHGDRYGS